MKYLISVRWKLLFTLRAIVRGACWEELLYQVLIIVGNAVPLMLLFTWVLEAAWESMSKTCLLSS